MKVNKNIGVGKNKPYNQNSLHFPNGINSGGTTPAPPSGGESGGSNWRYFATTDIDVLWGPGMLASLIKINRDGVETILPTGLNGILTGEDRLIAMAYDMSQAIYLVGFAGEILTTVGEAIEFFLKMEGKGMDYLGVEITKEEFYHIDKSGAYIQHIDGTLYTGDQWTAKGFSNDEANGIAVIIETENISLVVAKDSLGKLPWSSMPDTLIEGITTPTDYNEAMTDRTGVGNTAIIAAADPNSAASACANYTFPNGQKGYLVAFGESFAIENNDTLLELIGGTPLGDVYIWTSTQYNAEKAWQYRVNGLFDHSGRPKSNNFEVRPICTLENYKFATD